MAAATATRSIGRLPLLSGGSIPLLGLGTWLSAPSVVKDAVRLALDCGYPQIDTAAVYGNESAIGEALKEAFASGKHSRESVFVVTKLWVDSFEPSRAHDAIRKSIGKLGLPSVDLMLIHFPFEIREGAKFPLVSGDGLGYSPERVLGAWNELRKARDEGLIRHIGVSNFTKAKIERLIADSGEVPAVNQVELHPYLPQDGLLDYCKSKGIVVQAYSPLGNPGFHKDAPGPHLLDDSVLAGIAKRHGKSVAQVLIRWCIQRGVVCLPKSVTEARIAENIDVLDFELDADDLAAIAALNKGSAGRRGKADFMFPDGCDLVAIWDGEPESL